MNESIIFKNITVQIDSYVISKHASEYYNGMVLRSLKRVLKTFNIDLDFQNIYSNIKERIIKLEEFTVNYIMVNEKYMGNSLIKIEVKPEVEVKPEDSNSHRVDTSNK